MANKGRVSLIRKMQIHAWLLVNDIRFKLSAAQIKPGTLIYFDEMNHLDHEPRAFDDEFTSQNSIKFKPVCSDRTLAHVSFECIT
jgi:hypothetical protein